ncbi:MAG: polysaccharide deacetylase family protein [Lachnospiraceae bacterium]
MEEKKIPVAWYRFRGVGLLCLCSAVFFAGAYMTGQKSVAVNSTAGVVKESRSSPVCSVAERGKRAALTFDLDGGSASAQAILDILEQHDVKATFFVTGKWAQQYPEDVRRIAAAGHDLGNHSQSHRDMTFMEKREIQQEIQTVHEAVHRMTGVEMKVFRAPYGAYSDRLLQVIGQSGYLPVEWDVDSQDWKNYGVESIVEAAQLKNGSIIHLHNEADPLIRALDPLVREIRAQGYELVPVSEMIRWSGYVIDETGRQIPE